MASAPRAEGGGGRGGAASSAGQTKGEMSLQGPDGLAQTVRIAHSAAISRSRSTNLLHLFPARPGHSAGAGPSSWTTGSATSGSSRASRSPSNSRVTRAASTRCTSTLAGAGNFLMIKFREIDYVYTVLIFGEVVHLLAHACSYLWP